MLFLLVLIDVLNLSTMNIGALHAVRQKQVALELRGEQMVESTMSKTMSLYSAILLLEVQSFFIELRRPDAALIS